MSCRTRSERAEVYPIYLSSFALSPVQGAHRLLGNESPRSPSRPLTVWGVNNTRWAIVGFLSRTLRVLRRLLLSSVWFAGLMVPRHPPLTSSLRPVLPESSVHLRRCLPVSSGLLFGLACRDRRLVLIGLACRDHRLLIFGLACRNRRFSLFGLACRNLRVLSSALPGSSGSLFGLAGIVGFSLFLRRGRSHRVVRAPCCVQLLGEITGWGWGTFFSVNLARSSHGFGYSSEG